MTSIPPPKKLTPNDAVDVLEEIIEIQNESYLLGLKLKLPEHEVKSIHSMYQEPRRRLLHVLITASQQEEPGLSWRTIIDALQSAAINAVPLARKLEAKYCRTTQPLSAVGSCTVDCQSVVKSPLDLYASYLKDLYKQEPFPIHNKWPHVVGRKFINLSLIQKDLFSHSSSQSQPHHQYTEAMFHGGASGFSSDSHFMTMSDIAKTADGSFAKGMQRCILVEGAPGVGKSTFAWKVCRKWGKGKILQQYRVLLLLRLREKRVRKVKTEEDLFKLFKPIATQELCETGGDGILLLLDGWDELPEAYYKDDSFFLDLLKGQVLPHATVLVTSRPHASEVILSECVSRILQHIRIVGFTAENVKAFISSNAGDVVEGLTTYIASYPHIKGMMCNPLNAAIVVKVYKDSYKENSPIPKTTTELYSSLTRILLLQYLKESPEHSKTTWRLRQLSDLPQDVHDKVIKISEVAFRGITNNQQVIFDDLSADFDTLGILQCVPELYVDEGTVLSYNFLHLTIQEYFAAYYMSLQSITKQEEMFVHYKFTTSMKMVLLFFAGITQFRGISDEHLVPLLGLYSSKRKRDSNYSLIGSRIMSSSDGIRILFEANERIRALNALEHIHITLPIHTSFDCYVLGFVISSTICSWNVSLYNIAPKSFMMLARGTIEQNQQCGARSCNVQLRVENSLQTRRQLIDCGSLSTAHPMFLNRLTTLKLINVCLFNNPFVTPHLKLETLELNGCHWCKPETQEDILRSLYHQKTLKDLTLTNGSCFSLLFTTPIEHVVLSEWLQSPACNLTTLNITGNWLSMEITESVMTALCQSRTIEVLDISRSKLKPEMLKRCLPQLPLVKLSFNYCFIEDAHAEAIARAFAGNTKLEELHLQESHVSEAGLLSLSHMMKCNTSLKKLDLEDCVCYNLSSRFIENLKADNRINFTVISPIFSSPPEEPLYNVCYFKYFHNYY